MDYLNKQYEVLRRIKEQTALVSLGQGYLQSDTPIYLLFVLKSKVAEQ